MQDNTEFIRNILAAIVSAGTITFMFLRYIRRERLEQARQISDIIRSTAEHVYSHTQLESRVNQLEKLERENVDYMKSNFMKLHERLDQIFTIIAQKD